MLKRIYKMQHLEGSSTPVLYIDARFLKVKGMKMSFIFMDPCILV